MRRELADDMDKAARSHSCLRSAHQDCPHLLPGFGGGISPRRLRPEFGVMLCRCPCHGTCPASGQRMAVPLATWRESCTCPAAEDERQRQDQPGAGYPDLATIRAREQRLSDLRKEAFRAAKAASAGKSRDQLKDLYLTELRARKLKVPTPRLLDAQIEAISGNTGAAADTTKLLRGIFRP